MFLSNRGSFRPETSGAYTLRRRGRRRPKSGSAIGACAVARLAGSGGPIGDYYGSANSYSKEGSLTPALIRSIMEEEKPNQVEQVRIPKRSIARFFRPSATPAEVESRIVRALELLEQAERRRDGLGGA